MQKTVFLKKLSFEIEIYFQNLVSIVNFNIETDFFIRDEKINSQKFRTKNYFRKMVN